ncbi:MAG: cobalamin-binding protein [bacterium]|nr:cobalamin-binding protein [bacterium]
MEILTRIAEELELGDDERVVSLTEEALAAGIKAQEILNGGLLVGMEAVGVKFRAHEVFLPDVLLTAKAMNLALKLIEPTLITEGAPELDKVIIGTVRGDLHDIGKNLVGIMLRGAGFKVIDLGKDVSPERFIKTAREEGARIIGMSALLTTTMVGMKDVIDLINAEGLSGKLLTVVGGAPVSEEYARKIGADAYAFDASRAIDCVRDLLAQSA